MKKAAVAWGYPTLAAWKKEHPVYKGEVIAFYLYDQMRDGYEMEKQRERAESKAAKNKPGAASRSSASLYGRELLQERLQERLRKERGGD